MDVTVYLPDEIGKQAKEAEVNLSGTLRAAVEADLARRERFRESAGKLGEPQVFEVRLVKNNAEYTGRITGWSIDHNNDWDVFLTDDNRVIVYNQFRTSYEEMSTDEAREQLEPDLFPKALLFLGVEPVIDL